MAEIAPFRLGLQRLGGQVLPGPARLERAAHPQTAAGRGELSSGAVRRLGQAQSKAPNHLTYRVREA